MRIFKGAIFCHVARIIHKGQEILLITAGNQKWQGAAPNFKRRAQKIKEEPGLIIRFGAENIISVNTPNKRRPDPMAWARKYFIAASLSRFMDDLVIKGTNERRLSSKPIQTYNH
jgi:hypothetical protein